METTNPTDHSASKAKKPNQPRPRISDAARRAIEELAEELGPYELAGRHQGEKPPFVRTLDWALEALGIMPAPPDPKDAARVVNVKQIVARRGQGNAGIAPGVPASGGSLDPQEPGRKEPVGNLPPSRPAPDGIQKRDPGAREA